MSQAPSHLRGFAIVSAIFILVVLAALGAFVVSVTTNQQLGSAIDIQGVRAYQAARAGIEWGLYRVQSSNAFDYANPNTRSCPAAVTTFIPAAPTLAGFTVTVTCTASADASGGRTIYLLTATACNQPTAIVPSQCPNTFNPRSSYIERRVSASL